MNVTAKNMANANLQEIFDHVVSCLKKQGQPSIESGDCRYRTTLGLKCAAGFCIADDDYNKHMEFKSFEDICEDYGTFGYDDDQVDLINQLQNAHDKWHDDIPHEGLKQAFNTRFNLVAMSNNLTFQPWEVN